jgi:ribonuclease R
MRVTSPIRRYPDLVVHRIVKTLLADGADPVGDAEEVAAPQGYLGLDEGPKRRVQHDQQFEDVYPKDELIAIAQECSETERRAADAERELIEWKKIQFMQDRVGEDFDAMILSVTKYGAFVELGDMYIEGLVPIFSMTDDHYTYRETTREIRGGKSNKVYRPGMKVRVLLDRIDRGNRRLQFAILPDHGGGETASPEGTRTWIPRAGKTAERREKFAAANTERPTKNRKASPRSPSRGTPKPGRTKARGAPLSPSSPFAKFGADGSSVRKKSNKERIAAKNAKKNKKR